jgi:hypothetical protein
MAALQRLRSPCFRRYMHELGFEWIATMKIGSGCKVHLADGNCRWDG